MVREIVFVWNRVIEPKDLCVFVLLLLDLSLTPSVIVLDVFDGVNVSHQSKVWSHLTVYVFHDLTFCPQVLKLVLLRNKLCLCMGFFSTKHTILYYIHLSILQTACPV